MNKLRRNVWALGPGLLLSALVVSFTPGTALAEVIRLRTGEVVKGRPVERLSTEAALVVEDATTGNIRRFLWKVIEPEDRKRILAAWGRLPPTIEPVKGHVLVLTLEAGMTTEVRGLLSGDTKSHYRVLTAGKAMEIEKARVREVREEPMDPRAIWTPGQLVLDYIARLPKTALDETGLPTSATHLAIARYAEVLGAFGAARRHYREASRDEEAPHHKYAFQKEAEMRALLAEEGALTELRAARMALQLHSFRTMRARLQKLKAAHPEPSEALSKRIRELESDAEVLRERHFAAVAGRLFPKLVRKRIEAYVREERGDLTHGMAWLRRELPELAFEALVGRMRRQDDVTLEEARAFWGQRPRRAWRTTTYGSGSFILLGALKGRPPGGKGLPKPPTRDVWWARAKDGERVSWMFTYFMEKSLLFDLEETQGKACSTCAGRGFESHRLANGRMARFLCRRCAGTQFEKVIRYR